MIDMRNEILVLTEACRLLNMIPEFTKPVLSRVVWVYDDIEEYKEILASFKSIPEFSDPRLWKDASYDPNHLIQKVVIAGIEFCLIYTTEIKYES